jgi:phosphoribosylaminoimidazole-succinocarboxamide synthase
LDGSGWKEYQETGKLAGYDVPAGLNRYDALPEPLFTPARKMLEGHDENITVNIMREEYGVAETNHLQDISLKLFKFAYDKLKERGIMLLDTKFEFGLVDGQMTLIDEVFTPDSSRFRVLPDSENGESQPLALDKQYLRDHLTQLGFTGEGEPPKLDDDVRNELSNRYKRVFQMITGSTLEEALTAQK